MPFEPSSRAAHLPGTDHGPGEPSTMGGDGFAGGCLSLIALLVEIPVAVLLVLASVLRGWGRADDRTAAPTMDWAPVLWLGGFTLGVLVVAAFFLRTAHPVSGTIQLLIAAIALIYTITAWHEQYEHAHPAPPPTCPTRAGTPCATSNPVDRTSGLR